VRCAQPKRQHFVDDGTVGINHMTVADLAVPPWATPARTHHGGQHCVCRWTTDADNRESSVPWGGRSGRDGVGILHTHIIALLRCCGAFVYQRLRGLALWYARHDRQTVLLFV
jgi:hypothetical protein